MNKKKMKNDKTLSGPEWFFVIFIIILIILTGVFAFLINKIGPENQPYFKIQDEIYYENHGDDYTAHVYVSNLGGPEGEAVLEWKIYTKDGNKYAEGGDGEMDITVDGRKTDEFTIDFTPQYEEEYMIHIKIHYEDEIFTQEKQTFYPAY
ncbi:MAG: hypothetical protein R6U61_03055 [Thermoplasmata archaeon]